LRDEIGPFAESLPAETVQLREFAEHVFDFAAVVRVFYLSHNLCEWMVGTTGIEPVTPTMSTQGVDEKCSEISGRSALNVLIRSRLDHGYLGRFLGGDSPPDPEMRRAALAGSPVSQSLSNAENSTKAVPNFQVEKIRRLCCFCSATAHMIASLAFAVSR
jgi:hypothetical protein